MLWSKLRLSKFNHTTTKLHLTLVDKGADINSTESEDSNAEVSSAATAGENIKFMRIICRCVGEYSSFLDLVVHIMVQLQYSIKKVGRVKESQCVM